MPSRLVCLNADFFWASGWPHSNPDLSCHLSAPLATQLDQSAPSPNPLKFHDHWYAAVHSCLTNKSAPDQISLVPTSLGFSGSRASRALTNLTRTAWTTDGYRSHCRCPVHASANGSLAPGPRPDPTRSMVCSSLSKSLTLGLSLHARWKIDPKLAHDHPS